MVPTDCFRMADKFDHPIIGVLFRMQINVFHREYCTEVMCEPQPSYWVLGVRDWVTPGYAAEDHNRTFQGIRVRCFAFGLCGLCR